VALAVMLGEMVLTPDCDTDPEGDTDAEELTEGAGV
jgi:hypothetical protein